MCVRVGGGGQRRHQGVGGWASVTRAPRIVHSISEQRIDRNAQRFQGGFIFEAHRLLYHSTLGLRVTKKKVRSTTDMHGPVREVQFLTGPSGRTMKSLI